MKTRGTQRDTEGHRETQREEIGRLLASSCSGFLCVISVFLCVPLLLILTIVVHAHGTGTPQLLNAPTGPYLLSVWTDPDPLRVDEAHVVVAVVEPVTQEFSVSDVVVTVRLRWLADPTVELATTLGVPVRCFFAPLPKVHLASNSLTTHVVPLKRDCGSRDT